jgi:hypothetical protein
MLTFISSTSLDGVRGERRGIVVREGRGGAHREFTYRSVRPHLAAKAIGEPGGGLAGLSLTGVRLVLSSLT